jgi:hypothetical protein
MSDDTYQHVVEREATRELADKLFDLIRAEDAPLALDAIGITIVRVLMSAAMTPGVTRQEVIEGWMGQLRRCVASID